MTSSTVHFQDPCPVCQEGYTLLAADFPLEVGGASRLTPLYYCLSCRSAFFTHEPADSSSIRWHIKVRERNLKWSQSLDTALKRHIKPQHVIDIGCGIGTWISHLDSLSISTMGYEPGTQAAKYGRDHFGLQNSDNYFTANAALLTGPVANLLTCILVFEHLRDPRSLALEMSNYCRATGAWAFVSVPFLHRLEHIRFNSESPERNVFNAVASHVTYFSEEGMKIMFRSMGLKQAAPKITTPEGAWGGYLFCPENN